VSQEENFLDNFFLESIKFGVELQRQLNIPGKFSLL
jgi:hypothetical protein